MFGAVGEFLANISAEARLRVFLAFRHRFEADAALHARFKYHARIHADAFEYWAHPGWWVGGWMRRWWVWERAIEVLLLLLNLWVGGLVVGVLRRAASKARTGACLSQSALR